MYKSVIFSLFFSSSIFGQTISPNSICNFYGEEKSFSDSDICKNNNSNNIIEIELITDNILNTIGLERNFALLECKEIQNCLAINLPSENGYIRYIIFDKSFLDDIESKTNSIWSKISIIAHEIGHHLQGHTLDGKGSRHSTELQADKFSGFILCKMGATLKDAQLALNLTQSNFASKTHPSKFERLKSVEEGFLKAQNENSEFKIIRDKTKQVIRSKRLIFDNTFLKIEYGSPSTKGRQIFGELIQYNEIWRTGANEATEVTFYNDVIISGKKIAAGTYTLYCIPNPKITTVILNPNLNQWGSYSYDKIKQDDVIRFKVITEYSNEITENLLMDFDQNGFFEIRWEKTVIRFPIRKY
jgi:hypothetical protein